MKRPKRANLRPPGRCIFCGDQGLTGEHMWPNWLREYIPREMQDHYVGSTTVGPKETVEIMQRRTGDPHSRKIKCVCRKCNNEWMSGLQEDAKPFIVPMLHGNVVRLHRKAQTLVAGWATMMVMVAEYLNNEMVAVPLSDREFLRCTQRPPAHWRIWIGRHRRDAHPLFNHNVLALTQKEIEGVTSGLISEPNTQTSTICLGKHLVIYVMSSTAVWNIVRRWRIDPRVNRNLAQIWPVRSSAVAWPPPSALTDAGLDLLAQQFFRAVTRHGKLTGIIQ
jgi:hypothetical protein